MAVEQEFSAIIVRPVSIKTRFFIYHERNHDRFLHGVSMSSEDEFITRLMGFGLAEKEAHCYFYLLKYGPKTPSPLAKALHTYREDMHRTLNNLIEKGVVRPSLDAPTMYTAVELENALESALRKHESELREMERRKQELEELSLHQRFRPSDEVGTFKILKSMSEVMTTTLSTLASAEKEWIAVGTDTDGIFCFVCYRGRQRVFRPRRQHTIYH